MMAKLTSEQEHLLGEFVVHHRGTEGMRLAVSVALAEIQGLRSRIVSLERTLAHIRVWAGVELDTSTTRIDPSALMFQCRPDEVDEYLETAKPIIESDE